jgi:hypothetical protein
MKKIASVIVALIARRNAARNDERARWAAIKNAAVTPAARAAIAYTEEAAQEAVRDMFGPHALLYPSAAVLTAFAAFAIEQYPNAARETPAVQAIGRFAAI